MKVNILGLPPSMLGLMDPLDFIDMRTDLTEWDPWSEELSWQEPRWLLSCAPLAQRQEHLGKLGKLHFGDGPESAVQTNWLNETHYGFLACYTSSLLVKIVKTLGFLVYEMYLQSLCTEAG